MKTNTKKFNILKKDKKIIIQQMFLIKIYQAFYL